MTIAVVKQTFPVVVQSQKPVIVNVGNVASPDLNIATGTLGIAHGGTGATTATAARTNLATPGLAANTFTADQSATAFVAPLVHGADVSVGDGGSITIRGGNSTAISSSAGQVIITGGSGDGDDGNVTINTVFIDPNGAVTATSFAGDGSALTNLTASNLSTGTAPTARLGSGTASSSTFLRGDQTWATVPVPTAANPNASVGTTPVIGVGSTFMRSDAAPAISQSIVPTWTGLHTFNGGVAGNGSGWTSLTATNLSSGTVPTARLGTGTANSTTYLRGDQTWATTPTAANPTGSVGTTAVNGTATTFLRSDAAPAISQSITPTWTGLHTFNGGAVVKQANGGLGGLTVKRFVGNSTDLLTCIDSNLAGTLLFRVTPTSVNAMDNTFTINSDGSFFCSGNNLAVNAAGNLQTNGDLLANGGLQIYLDANINGSITTGGNITAANGTVKANGFTDPNSKDGLTFGGSSTSDGGFGATYLTGALIVLQGAAGASLPTSDPSSTGALWVDTGGVLKVSGY